MSVNSSSFETLLPPILTFTRVEGVPAAVKPVWEAMRRHDCRTALSTGRELLQTTSDTALLIALAVAEMNTGNSSQARMLANTALQRCPVQWAGHRVIIEVLQLEGRHDEAYLYTSMLNVPDGIPTWDEPLSLRDQNLLGAALAWKVRDWEGAFQHVSLAYPEGIESIPDDLLDDVFRLTLYLNKADLAARVARRMIKGRSIHYADVLLQTFVQQGWIDHALSLYRTIFNQSPEDPLLRRRMVGLCIRTGAIEEARRLSRPGALEIYP